MDQIMTVPRVTIIMPAYNAEKYIQEAITSIMNQTYNDYELLVVNDGSNDKTEQIVYSFCDNRIKLINNYINQGIAYSRNVGLIHAKGKYIAWLDADDISHPDRIKKQVDYLDRNPHIIICGTWVRTIGNTPGKIWRYPQDKEFIRCRLLFDSPVATSSIMMRRCKSFFNIDCSPAEDYEMWERISLNHYISNIPKVLTYYRTHDTQNSVLHSDNRNRVVEMVQRRQLKALRIEYSEQEMNLHQRLGAWSFGCSKDFMTKSYNWLMKLQCANTENPVYPIEAFKKVLAERWFFVCRGSSRLGIETWNMFLNTNLQRDVEVYKKIYLLSKCLLKV